MHSYEDLAIGFLKYAIYMTHMYQLAAIFLLLKIYFMDSFHMYFFYLLLELEKGPQKIRILVTASAFPDIEVEEFIRGWD